MQIQDQSEGVKQCVGLLRNDLLRAVATETVIAPAHEAQVHRTIDLLRAARADSSLLNRAEGISCTLRHMNVLLREGRINAYHSARLRLRQVAYAL